MKKFSSLKLAATIAVLVPLNYANAELFIAPRASTNTISVADGEAIVFTAFSGDIGVCEVAFLAKGQSDEVSFPSRNQRVGGAVAGPCEMIVRNLTGSFVAEFIRTPNTSLKTVIVGGIIVTNGVRKSRPLTKLDVPAGQKIRFFASREHAVEAKFVVGPKSTDYRELAPNAEVSGPVSVTLQAQGYDRGILVSYAISDGPSILPELGLIKVHSGSHEVAIEKSSDLRTWNTVLSAPVSASGEGFFRLRVVK